MAALCEGPGISTGHSVLELLRVMTISVERSIHQVSIIFLSALPRRARISYWFKFCIDRMLTLLWAAGHHLIRRASAGPRRAPCCRLPCGLPWRRRP